jgi:drug/metabolite transporter (DMT)-like permease
MNISDLFYFFMALLAYSCISIGFVLQKKGIHWMGWKEKKNKTYYRYLFLWLTGFVIMNIYGVPSAVALKRLPAHITAAFAGWGIVVLVFLSGFFLKEKLFKTDYLFSFMIVLGICLLSLFENSGNETSLNIAGLAFLSVIPAVLFGIGFWRGLSKKTKTLVFAAVCGMTAGLMVVFLRLLVVEYQYRVALYFRSPNLYLYIIFALISLISLQVACKKGEMMIIGPVQYSSAIIYPMLAAFFVFQQILHPMQLVAALMICLSIVFILKKR